MTLSEVYEHAAQYKDFYGQSPKEVLMHPLDIAEILSEIKGLSVVSSARPSSGTERELFGVGEGMKWFCDSAVPVGEVRFAVPGAGVSFVC